MFEENVKIRYSEMDCNLVLKPSAMLQFLQDMASDNAEKLGFGYSYIVKHNLAWFLLKYHLEFEKYPQNIYNLTIKTEPRGYNKIFAYRDFYIENDGNIIGRAASTWALVDLKSKAMANVAEILSDNQCMVQYQKREDDLEYSKIRLPELFEISKIFEIRYDDLDVNKHVNNANYIIWAFESLDIAFRKSHKLKILDMVFKKEITYGAKVASKCHIDNCTTFHILKNSETNEELCIIKAEWVAE